MDQRIRPIRVHGDVAYIQLTKGYEAVIDASDVGLVAGRNWMANVRKYGCYAYRKKAMPDGGPLYLHRFLLGEPAGFDVDHIDGDQLNNRRSNLRLATRSQNMQNSKMRKDNTSGHKGVVWLKATKRWRAQVVVNGKSRYFGTFPTKEEAVEAVSAARERLHGAFARKR